MPGSDTDVQNAVRTAYRAEYARLIARLTRIVRDVDRAEELAQDTLVAALEHWPASGIPESPGGWLMATAQRRAIDALRRSKRAERRHSELGYQLERQEKTVPDIEAALDDDIGDDLLRLVFTSCHPALSTEARVALTLRLVGGLTTDEIARAFLASEPAIAQRIVRAKRTLAEEHVAFEVPHGAELAARLSSVLEVVYLIFNEGYAATAGDDVVRPALCEEALRLARLLAVLAPDEAEVHGLASLLELQSSRTEARVDAAGDPVALVEQDRSRWDSEHVARGLSALERAQALGGEGPYALQAAIAACHARASSSVETDWTRIVELYRALAEVLPSPIVEVNRAVAIAMLEGPAAGLARLDALDDSAVPALRTYPLLPAVRADLLYKLLRFEEARDEFTRAASLTRNLREKSAYLTRAAECARSADAPDS